MVERYMVTCTCDDNCDDPCPVHGREGELQNEVVEYREDFAAIAHELASFWGLRGKKGGTAEVIVVDAVATLRAIGRIVERRALALAEKTTSGDAPFAADVMALIRQSLGGSPFDRQGKEEETDDKV